MHLNVSRYAKRIINFEVNVAIVMYNHMNLHYVIPYPWGICHALYYRIHDIRSEKQSCLHA